MKPFLRFLQNDGEYKDKEIISDKGAWESFAPLIIGLSVLVVIIVCCSGFVLFVKFVILREKVKPVTLQVSFSHYFGNPALRINTIIS